MPIFAILGQFIVRALVFAMGSLVAKFLAVVGLSLVAYDLAVAPLLSIITGYFVTLPSEWQSYLGMLQVDRAITVLVSAYGIRMALTSTWASTAAATALAARS